MRRLPVVLAAVFVAMAAHTSWAEEPDGSFAAKADGSFAAKAKDPSVGDSWSSDNSRADVPSSSGAPVAVSEPSTSEPTMQHHVGPDSGSTSPTPTETGAVNPVGIAQSSTPADDAAKASDAAASDPSPTDSNTPDAAAAALDSTPSQADNDPGLDADQTPAVEKDVPKPALEPQHVTAPVVPSNPPFLIGEDVRDIVGRTRVAEETKPDLRAVSAFYAARRGEIAWTTAKGLTPHALALVAELKNAADWGLDPSRFELPSEAIISKSGKGEDLQRPELADAEMKISLAALTYARQARGGRIPEPAKQLASYLDRMPNIKEPSLVLEDLAGSTEPDAYLRSLHPHHPQFEKLRQRYVELKDKADAARNIVRIPGGGKIKPGEKDPVIALLRERLNVPPAPGTDVEIYDTALVDAVKAIQNEKGLRADGILGKSTRAALNDIEVPNPERLLANMEQWRWMPENLGDTYIQVNIPEFMFRIVKGGKVIHEERVVTGQTDKQTPVFSDVLETVIFHPRWNVPESIKVLELYPNLARGGGSFQRQGLKLMRNGREISPSSVDWSQADIRNFDVYQPSGPGNVLGEIKFIFPNKHGVYMHDTGAKSLFNEPSRPFSHGCMRVRNPRKFAEVVLSLDKDWDRRQIDGILDSGSNEELPVPLEAKIPVHVTYFTAVIDDTGTERDFKDVYGHEQRIKLALQGRFDQIAVGPDHLAPVKFERAKYASSPEDDWNSFFSGPSNQPKKKFGTFSDLFGYSDGPPPSGKSMKPGKPGKQNKQAKTGANGDFFKNWLNN